MTAKTDPAKLDNAITLYLSGKTIREASAEAGVSFSPLRREMVRRNIPRRSQRLDVPVAEIVNAYVAGESELAISKRLNIERIVIRRRLIEEGVSIRGRSEAQRLQASQMTPEERRAQTKAANEASRGRTVPLTTQIKTAQTRERNQTGATDTERELAAALASRGLPTTLQKAIGRYNVDIAAGPVAVELFGGTWHATGRHVRRAPKRFRYLLDEGWPFIIVWNARCDLNIAKIADYIASFAEVTRGDPTRRGEYRVIWGDGEEASPVQPNLDEVSHIPSLCGRSG